MDSTVNSVKHFIRNNIILIQNFSENRGKGDTCQLIQWESIALITKTVKLDCKKKKKIKERYSQLHWFIFKGHVPETTLLYNCLFVKYPDLMFSGQCTLLDYGWMKGRWEKKNQPDFRKRYIGKPVVRKLTALKFMLPLTSIFVILN